MAKSGDVDSLALLIARTHDSGNKKESYKLLEVLKSHLAKKPNRNYTWVNPNTTPKRVTKWVATLQTLGQRKKDYDEHQAYKLDLRFGSVSHSNLVKHLNYLDKAIFKYYPECKKVGLIIYVKQPDQFQSNRHKCLYSKEIKKFEHGDHGDQESNDVFYIQSETYESFNIKAIFGVIRDFYSR